MTNFILITLMCVRTCVPIQAEMFINKTACNEAKRTTKTDLNINTVCVPLVKTR